MRPDTCVLLMLLHFWGEIWLQVAKRLRQSVDYWPPPSCRVKCGQDRGVQFYADSRGDWERAKGLAQRRLCQRLNILTAGTIAIGCNAAVVDSLGCRPEERCSTNVQSSGGATYELSNSHCTIALLRHPIRGFGWLVDRRPVVGTTGYQTPLLRSESQLHQSASR